jgi:energy-coupling factor transporter ATP-binding protein EcfA2
MSAARQLVGGTPLATVTAQDLVAEKLGDVEWVIPSFIPAGGFTVLYGAPKSGKTTLAAHMAAAIIGSRLFLGGHWNLAQPVLWLDLEQPRRVTRARMIEIGAHQALEHLHIWTGRPPTLSDLLATVDKLRPPVVFVDSLSRWLLLEDENDNAELTRRLGPIVTAFQERDTGLAVIHHDRKSEGDSGRNIRGAGALLAMCDVAIECRKEKEDGEYTDLRKLTLVSRLEAERVLSVRLTAEGFVEEAPPSKGQDDQILAQLIVGPQTVKTLLEVLPLDNETLRARLDFLTRHRRVVKTGRGVKGDPHVFRLSPILSDSFKRAPTDAQSKVSPILSEAVESTPTETPAISLFSSPTHPLRGVGRKEETGQTSPESNGNGDSGEAKETNREAGELAEIRI